MACSNEFVKCHSVSPETSPLSACFGKATASRLINEVHNDGFLHAGEFLLVLVCVMDTPATIISINNCPPFISDTIFVYAPFHDEHFTC
jgi:hypothetical protein